MKKFINRTEDVVEEMMQGLAVFHPSSTRLLGHNVMVRADAEQAHDQQVAVICRAISELGGAKPGDRTMLDALDPFVKALKKRVDGKASRESILAAVEAAERGLEATARMKPRLGRSSYLGDRVLGCPDPGAKAVAVSLRAASEALFAR
jgi:dihydroxyacetone kinase